MFGLGSTVEDIAKQVLLLHDDGILVFDHNMRVIFANHAAETIFGYTQRQIAGLPLNAFIPDRFHMQHGVFVDEFAREENRVKYMGERTRKIIGQRSDGSEFYAAITIMRPPVSGKPAYVAIVRDQKVTTDNDRELLRIAATDPLTGVLNKDEFSAIAEKEALRSKRYSRPFSVAVIHLDALEKLNEEHGYNVGDRALQWVAKICSNTLRNVDIFARWSGPSFAVLFPETPVNGAEIIARRLVKMIADDSFKHQEQEIKTTISIGVVGYDDRKTLLDEAMRNAAAALSDVIKAGGNDVKIFDHSAGT